MVGAAIDGRVCRLWRQIILDSPRVWAYLEIIYMKRQPSMGQIRSWLRRSGTVPLHIRVLEDLTFDEGMNITTLYDLLGEHHTRIESLRMTYGEPSFFEGRAFPCMRLLDVKLWYWPWPSHSLPSLGWGPMPQLRSLHLGTMARSVAPLVGISSLNTLSVDTANCTSLPQHSQSLTTLMLGNIRLDGIISGPVTSLRSPTYHWLM